MKKPYIQPESGIVVVRLFSSVLDTGAGFGTDSQGADELSREMKDDRFTEDTDETWDWEYPPAPPSQWDGKTEPAADHAAAWSAADVRSAWGVVATRCPYRRFFLSLRFGRSEKCSYLCSASNAIRHGSIETCY